MKGKSLSIFLLVMIVIGKSIFILLFYTYRIMKDFFIESLYDFTASAFIKYIRENGRI